jgi:hypothetical protein
MLSSLWSCLFAVILWTCRLISFHTASLMIGTLSIPGVSSTPNGFNVWMVLLYLKYWLWSSSWLKVACCPANYFLEASCCDFGLSGNVYISGCGSISHDINKYSNLDECDSIIYIFASTFLPPDIAERPCNWFPVMSFYHSCVALRGRFDNWLLAICPW